jgi:hypothetical protein
MDISGQIHRTFGYWYIKDTLPTPQILIKSTAPLIPHSYPSTAIATAAPPIANIALPVTTDPPAWLELVVAELLCDAAFPVPLALLEVVVGVVVGAALPVAVGPDLMTSELLVVAVPAGPVIVTAMYV